MTTSASDEILFGAFLTPSAASPETVVGLARLAEQSGLDLVSVQDHPYQPAFLDTWTLLSYLAAATTTVRLVPNVLNLPLRPAPVLARAAASLDVLSGGRVELGIGAGGFWDPIVAMGGARLSPGESVEALEEAIAVLRALWDTGHRGVLRAGGRHHHVEGAKPGPPPAHPIGLWVGAYGPRMLALTGRLGDGWIPSWAYLENGVADLDAGNARIDAAATDAGRDPRSVRRVLNIDPSLTGADAVERLADLVLAHGVTGLVLATDDPVALARFGEDTAPAVRERVAAERGPASAPQARTTTAATAHLDESSRPVAPPGPAGHVYTDQARAAGRHLVDVHDHLRAELDQLRDVVRQVRAGRLTVGDARSAVNAMSLRQNDWTLGAYCASYCRILTQHHTLEDTAIFPHLRAGEPGLAPVLDRLEEEHHVVHGLLEAVDRALVAHVETPAGLDDLDSAVDELARVLLSHLAYEEDQLVEPLSRLGMYPGQL